MGQSPDSRFYNTDGLGLPFLQGSAQFGKAVPSTTISCSTPIKVAPSGSILFSVRAPVGDINRADRDYCIGRGLAAIIPFAADPSYIEYYLRFLRPAFDRITQGSTFGAINSAALGACEIRIPSKMIEQAAIALVFASLDRAIDETEALIAKQHRIKTGLMQDLFTRGIDKSGILRDPATHEFRPSPIGPIPRDWKSHTVGSACHFVSGGTPSRSRPEWWIGSQCFLTAKDMKSFDLAETTDHLAAEVASRRCRVMPPNTVFILVRGMTLAHSFPVCVSARPFAFNQDIKAICAKGDLRNRFLGYWFLANEKRFLRLATEATHGTKKLDTAAIQAAFFPVPSPDEQAIIESRLDAINTLAAQQTHLLHKLHRLKAGLMQDLLTGKVSVDPLL
jgi:type I restriction enzyme S subunit